MYNFLRKYKLTKLTLSVINSLNRPISIKEIEKVSKELPPQKKVPGPGVFTRNSIKPSKNRHDMALHIVPLNNKENFLFL